MGLDGPSVDQQANWKSHRGDHEGWQSMDELELAKGTLKSANDEPHLRDTYALIFRLQM
jgi:hypothetical protein